MVLLSFAFFENVSFPLRLFPCLREYIYKKRMSEVFPSDIRFSFYHHNNYLCIGGFSLHFNLLYHDCTILACGFMKQRGVLFPLKFEKSLFPQGFTGIYASLWIYEIRSNSSDT